MATQNASPLSYNSITPYTDKDNMFLDLFLYLSFSDNQTLTLDLFPQIAINRWSFIVESWDSSFQSLFLSASQGDGFLTNAYSQVLNAIYASRLDSSYNPLSSPSFYQQCQDFLSLITLDSIKLTPLELDIVNRERQRVLGFTIANFQSMIVFLRIEKNNAYDLIGLGNSTYNSWVGRTGLSQQRDYFLSDLDIIKEMINAENKINGIIVGLKKNVIKDPNLIAFSNNAIDSSSNVRLSDVYVSYNMFPFELSIENMASKYMGDIQKKYELIAVNKLKSPFVDTKGERLFLLGNGSSNSVRITNTYPERYRVGSIVKAGSRLIGETTRKVLQVIDNKDNTVILFLSGDTNLGSLLTAHGAYVRCYLPDTLQDFSFVKIPTTVASKTPAIIQPTDSEIRKLDDALIAFGVDISVDPVSRDWQVDQSGNVKLAYGFTNVAQAVRSVVSIPKGTLVNHPNYGFNDYTGDQFTDNVPTKVSGDIQAAVLRDPRFTDMKINQLTVSETGEIIVTSSVKITGTDQYLPLNFNI
jgi:hypothetical protein